MAFKLGKIVCTTDIWKNEIILKLLNKLSPSNKPLEIRSMANTELELEPKCKSESESEFEPEPQPIELLNSNYYKDVLSNNIIF